MFSFSCECEFVLEYGTNHPQAKWCMGHGVGVIIATPACIFVMEQTCICWNRHAYVCASFIHACSYVLTMCSYFYLFIFNLLSINCRPHIQRNK